MSIDLMRRCRECGTRFRLFPQARFPGPAQEPEIVWLLPTAGKLFAGPSDDRMYVVDPLGKPYPYGIARGPYGSNFLYYPPWNGPVRAPALPDRNGHFDYLAAGTPEFEAAHAYAVARFVLDIWEDFFGRPIGWHFLDAYDRLEIVLLHALDNATAGYGFMELGSKVVDGDRQLFSLNFDIIAHEMGHLILYSEIGLPNLDAVEGEFFGFHECGADLVALIATLHFDSVVDQLLRSTRGNLYTFNELNRFAELSPNKQIRIAGNSRKMSDFAWGWTDEHDLSEPLTGALFDTFVDVFHDKLVRRGVISAEVEALMDQLERRPELADVIQAFFDPAYAENPESFRSALLEARDEVGTALAELWRRLPADYLNYDDVGTLMLEVDRDLTGGCYAAEIIRNFQWREIGLVPVGPRRAVPAAAASHAFSARTVMPAGQVHLPRMSYRERWQVARRSYMVPPP
jgi:hypothetical protein